MEMVQEPSAQLGAHRRPPALDFHLEVVLAVLVGSNRVSENFSSLVDQTAVRTHHAVRTQFQIRGLISFTVNPRDDVWRFRMADSTWTWMNGTQGSGVGFVGPVGVYGARNTPGNRLSMCYTYDRFKNEGYLFGGVNSLNGVYGDLWKIRFNDTYWAVVSGNLTTNLRPSTTGKGTPGATFNPSSRISPACAIDDVRGEIFVFGGRGFSSSGSIGP
jgi:hypothetical protein